MDKTAEHDTEEEAYELGRRDGWSEAVQHIDCLTGGDGEYYASTIPGRGCETPAQMIKGIVDRFNVTKAQPNASGLAAALREAMAAIEDDTGLDDAICCSGHQCGCMGSSHRQLLLHNLRAALTAWEAQHG